MAGRLQQFGGLLKDTEVQLSSEEICLACAIISTADYCVETTEQVLTTITIDTIVKCLLPPPSLNLRCKKKLMKSCHLKLTSLKKRTYFTGTCICHMLIITQIYEYTP